MDNHLPYSRRRSSALRLRHVSFVLSADLVQWLKEEAERRHETRSALVERLLRAHFHAKR